MSEKQKQVLVINGGSSSIKVSLFDRIGTKDSAPNLDPVSWTSNLSANLLESDDSELEALLLKSLKEKESSPDRIFCVGHRVVHGGSDLVNPVEFSDEVVRKIEDLTEISPLHNPIALKLYRAARSVLPAARHVAVFDTAFHSTLLKEAFVYPLPYEWYEKHGIRRYGFHGISHQYCSSAIKTFFLGSKIPQKIVVAHLGNGCSLSAIKDGISVDTSMGFTPLEGLMMGTRSGSIDPGIIFYLMQEKKFSLEQLEHELNHCSGLAGVSGIGKDLREIEAVMKNSERAKLAFDIFVRRITSGIAAMMAVMNGAEAIVFTGGIGEHSSAVRRTVCEGLKFLGVDLDLALNENCTTDSIISSGASSISVIRVSSREDLQIYRECMQLLS